MGECLDGGPQRYILLPKLHRMRCLLQWRNLHVQRNVRKRSKRYTMTCDTEFHKVLKVIPLCCSAGRG